LLGLPNRKNVDQSFGYRARVFGQRTIQRKTFMPKQGKIPRIFVVDDEQMIAETLSLILRRRGYSSRFFLNPFEALQVSLSEPPDLLISDVQMPQLSGIDLAIRMREQCPMCKILLFSGQAGTADLLEVARGQGYDFQLLSKPIHPSDLLRRIREQDPGWCPLNDPNVPVMILERRVPPRLGVIARDPATIVVRQHGQSSTPKE
jgi:CheY-like chemotaxis protein